MTRDERLINVALKIARKSEHKFPMGAIIALGNRIIALGINKIRTHPRQINYHNDENGQSIHAELDAILSCCNTDGATIYVARVLSNGTGGMAKPCKSCLKIIQSAGIKKIVYTTSTGIETL